MVPMVLWALLMEKCATWFVMFVLIWGLYVAILMLQLVDLFELLTTCVYEAHWWLLQGNRTIEVLRLAFVI